MKGVYIHIPFCIRKCKYCDFVSFADRYESIDKYIEALINEAREYHGEKIDTIFIGGGTPSVLSAAWIERVCKMCFDVFDVAENYEFTIEINPGTVDNEKIRAMIEGGINRVSVGVQSFNDDELFRIGRIHDAATAYNTIWQLKESGFENISLDLMTALPFQTMDSLKNTLNTAVNLPVTHISAYSLILEEGTPLEKEYSKGELILPDDDIDREMYSYTVDFLKKNGFYQYEISNFAKQGFECRHNIKYWTGEEYIGLGAAAHSYDGSKRYSNSQNIDEYISENKREVIVLSQDDKISEFIITGLRMSEGISAKVFYERFGKDIKDIFGNELRKFVHSGLMTFDGDRYSLTPKGIDVSNSILCEFV